MSRRALARTSITLTLGLSSIQMGASEMKAADQFTVIDDKTIKVSFPKPNKLELPNLAVPVAQILNSELAKKHVTAADPWAVEWVGRNDAGGGAYAVDSWKPGNEIVFKRFDAWKSGKLPAMQRVVVRQIASAGTRRALLEKGDADLSFNLPPKDFAELAKAGKLKVIGTPVDAELGFTPASQPHLRFVLWGKNITDTAYIQSTQETGYGLGYVLSPPRQFGGRVEFKF